MGQILSFIGVRGYLQFILSTIFPSLLLIAQLYHICYTFNVQRDNAIHETIRFHQKKYFESLENVHKRFESLDNDKKNLLVNLEGQKRLSEEAFRLEMAFIHDALRQNEYHLRVTNAALDETTTKINTAYDGFNDNSRKVNNKIRDLAAVDNILIEKVERLELASRGYVPANFKKAYQSLNITKRFNPQAATPRKNCLLQAHFLELSAQVERLNKTVYGKTPAAQEAPPPSIGTSSSVLVGASTSASIYVNVPSSSSTKSKFKKTLRRGYDRVANVRNSASLASLMSNLRCNLVHRQPQSSSSDYSDASTRSSNDQATTSSTLATTASTSTLESRIDSLHLAFSNQLKDIHAKIDQLASKVNKSKYPQATADVHHHTPQDRSNGSSQQLGDTVPLDLQVVILQDQVNGFHREFIAMEKNYRKNIETLHQDLVAVSTKQKELDSDNRTRWLAYEEFRHDSQGQLAELVSRYEATSAFQMKKIADVINYSEGNIQLLHDTTKRHKDSVALLAHTLEQLEQEINEATPFGKARASRETEATTSAVLHEKQCRKDQHLIVPSATKFINHMEGALRSDKAILDHNSKKLQALQLKIDSSREVENLRVQRELVHREFDMALKEIEMIKKKIEPEFENPPPLHQNGESSTTAVNWRRSQFLRQ
ncbi:hypothetical protein MAM1_0547d10887 [Mucor ambiguus]|uniref:Uncharacterized protein n=1 Tax=Mucor ambiguus TaxID=91626 RepID=A0A0C9N9C9_9FUNG|nr:hypothetical protein MAM1_0547d10887 [Mucor ambiguus]